jgi:hypothetical protein
MPLFKQHVEQIIKAEHEEIVHCLKRELYSALVNNNEILGLHVYPIEQYELEIKPTKFDSKKFEALLILGEQDAEPSKPSPTEQTYVGVHSGND